MRLFSELKRRNVLRMGAAYVVGAWLLIQVAETIFPLFGFDETPARIVVIVLAIGFVPTLIFAWAFELTPEGLKKEADVDRSESITPQTGRKLDRVIMVGLALALGYFAFDKFVLSESREANIAEDARQAGRSEALVESYGEKSIAVLAFDDMSPAGDQGYLSDGIAEELLNLLARIPDMRVISRSSAFSFKGQNLGLPEVAERLNVAHILEGSVRKAGNQIRVTAQLIEARSDTHLWSEIYERQLTARNVFAIQSDIAASIAVALNMVLSREDLDRLRESPTQNLDALEAFLLGKQKMAMRNRSMLVEASRYFGRAIALDTGYAAAYLGLAEVNLLLNYYGHMALDDALNVAEPALDKVLALEDPPGSAYASVGLSRVLQGDIGGAESAFQRAIALEPNSPNAYHWYGDVLISALGDAAAAVEMLEKARKLDPLSPVILVTLGQALEGIGEMPEALVSYRKALEVEPGFASAHSLMGMAYLALGDDAKAEYWIDRGMRLWPGEFSTNQAQVLLHRYRGEEELALAAARGMLARWPGNNVSLKTLVIYGQDSEAIEKIAPRFPELTCDSQPTIARNNIFQAINLSLALERTGQRDCAASWLDAIVTRLVEMPGRGHLSFGFLNAEAYARQGNREQALEALRNGLQEGLHRFWWIQVDGSPHMDSLRDDPEFRALKANAKEKLADVLKGVREREARGELGPMPD